MSVALVTGGDGFVGSHLCPQLLDLGWDVVIAGRGSIPNRQDAAHPTAGGNEIRRMQVELTDRKRVIELLEEVAPDVVFHLAGSKPQDGAATERLVDDIVGASVTVCAALRNVGRPTRVVLAGSSAQYGDPPHSPDPIDEEMPLRPVNTYGLAKAAAEFATRALAHDSRVEVVMARAFNHIGPGESASTVAGALARQVSGLAAGSGKRLRVVNPDAVRDFTDVRDIARGYVALAERGMPDRAYNLCSGRPTAVRDLVDVLLEHAGIDPTVADMVVDGQGIRHQVGSPERTRQETGWEALIPLERSLVELFDEVSQDVVG